MRASRASAIFSSRRPRWRGGVLLQAGKAFWAALTARPTSSLAPRGMVAIGVRRPGFSTVSVAPDALSTQAPSINMVAWRMRVSSVVDMGRVFAAMVAGI